MHYNNTNSWILPALLKSFLSFLTKYQLLSVIVPLLCFIFCFLCSIFVDVDTEHLFSGNVLISFQGKIVEPKMRLMQINYSKEFLELVQYWRIELLSFDNSSRIINFKALIKSPVYQALLKEYQIFSCSIVMCYIFPHLTQLIR